MGTTDTHKRAAATLRRMAAKIDTLTEAEAAQLARMAENIFAISTAQRGKMEVPREQKRGRKAQDGATLADIATAEAPADLSGMVSRWAIKIEKARREIAPRQRQNGTPLFLAALAVALVELGYISDKNQKAMHYALSGAIPERIRGKFGTYQTFSKHYPLKDCRIISAIVEQFKAP